MNIKIQFLVTLFVIIVPIACRTPYPEKKPSGGYSNSTTSAGTPAQHKAAGISCFKKGMMEEALDELKLAAEGIQGDGELHHYLGKSYYEKDKIDDAIAELLAALSYYKPDQTTERADVYNDLGLAYKRKNAYTESLSAFQESLVLNPSAADTNYNLALLYYDKKMLDESTLYLKKAIKLDPKEADAHFMLGLIYYKKKLNDKAIGEFRQTIELNPKDAESHNYLGLMYYEQGDLEKSVIEHKSAIQWDKNYTEAYNNLGIAL